MTSLKTGYLLFLAAFLFLSTVPTVAKVVNSVAECNQFLLEEKPPQLPGILKDGEIQAEQYKPICQTYDNKPRFLTLYDKNNKIPVFSAYKYIGITQETPVARPTGYWKIEPQLESKPGEKPDDMEDERKDQTSTDQATSKDYESKIYDKGHLNPSTHGYAYDDKESTMTLTNIVPQEKDFNQKRWKNMEDCITCVMNKFCRDKNDKNKIEGFVVTGAQPGNEKLNNKVNIPSTVWSAFCCYHPWTKMWIASAHWDENKEKTNDEYIQSQTLTALHNILEQGANLFPGIDCTLDKTLREYPIGSTKYRFTKECPDCR